MNSHPDKCMSEMKQCPSSAHTEETLSRILPILALLYLYVPFVIFVIGWLRPTVSIPIIAITLICLPRCCRAMPHVWIPVFTRKSILKLLAVVILLGFWLYASGVGSFTWANRDHLFRNTIFQMLVTRPWPVTSIGVEGVPACAQPTMLCYYIGFWLPAAALGKATSFDIARIILFVWAYLGIFLVYALLCSRFRRILLWPVLVFFLYSGADVLGAALKNLHSSHPIPVWSWASNLEHWSAYQYSCMTSQLFWVYNQAIPAWVATALLLCGLPDSIVLFVASCLMISAVFPFAGFLLLAGLFSFDRHLRHFPSTPFSQSSIMAFVRGFLSPPNVLGAIFIGIPIFIYLSGNTAGSSIGLYFHWTYPFFLAFELALPILPLLPSRFGQRTFWFVFFSLAFIPFVRIGSAIDFCMRASIPFLFTIMIWTIDDLAEALKTRNRYRLVAILAVLAIGAMTPLHEFGRTIVNTRIHSDIDDYYKIANKNPVQILGFFLDSPRDAVYAAPAEGTPFQRLLSKQVTP